MTPLLHSYADRILQPLRAEAGKRLSPHITGEYLLTQRAHDMQWPHPGQCSANGSCHVWPTVDGEWLALNLSRETDWATLPALFQENTLFTQLPQIEKAVARHSAESLLHRGRDLGLAVAIPRRDSGPVISDYATVVQKGTPRDRGKQFPKVLDLSSLWAGPLCSFLLQACGAQVTRVESVQRPDGARINPHPGAQTFWHSLNDGKQQHALDFHSAEDLRTLRHWIQEADIVIEGSRPRALKQLGIEAEKIVSEQAGKLWISITGYGRQEPEAGWIAFGDDAAMAAGLCEWRTGAPQFVGDAVADPLTGLHAARKAWELWQGGRSALLDINLYRVARYTAQQLHQSSCC